MKTIDLDALEISGKRTETYNLRRETISQIITTEVPDIVCFKLSELNDTFALQTWIEKSSTTEDFKYKFIPESKNTFRIERKFEE